LWRSAARSGSSPGSRRRSRRPTALPWPIPQREQRGWRTLQESLRPGAAGVIEDWAIEARPWGFSLEEIRVPVRIWHRRLRQRVPLDHSRYVARRIPGAQLTVMEGRGHLPAEGLVPIARALASDAAS
jgi:pimeloyl-ACP methyl ester carboxylesterase